MSRTSRRIAGSPALLAIGLLFILPAMAEAQLFPNLSIRRQREPRAAEPPFYAQVRRDYYGYFPTCWSRFPEGWACPCPNPELPNAAESFRKRPLDKPIDPLLGEPGLGPDDGDTPGDPGAADANMPPIPEPGRSPFDLNPMDDTPTAPANPRPAPAPSPDRGRSPFELEPKAEVSPASPATRGTPEVGAAEVLPPSTFRGDMPQLPEVAPTMISSESTLEPGSMTLAPDAILASNRESSRPNLGPLPEANPVAVMTPEPLVGQPMTAPVQAPQRRSLIGSLFGQGNRRRR
ncbi:hypothetical protein P12x_001384 [Tundrisphaera lichenicola]|uniref:hypothetical protein n=1 Tax=Tundrisphaera lichenicola TaxID=2029860 RepID=UPI003EB74C9B